MLASIYGGKWRIMRQRTEASDAERDVFSSLGYPVSVSVDLVLNDLCYCLELWEGTFRVAYVSYAH